MKKGLLLDGKMESLRTSEVLIRGDGQILVHNLTPSLARLMSDLDPRNEEMKIRAGSSIQRDLKFRQDSQDLQDSSKNHDHSHESAN